MSGSAVVKQGGVKAVLDNLHIEEANRYIEVERKLRSDKVQSAKASPCRRTRLSDKRSCTMTGFKSALAVLLLLATSMASQDQIDTLLSGVKNWNKWRVENPKITPDLSGAVLKGAKLSGANLRGTSLLRANLLRADLSRALLSEANLRGANLQGTIFREADLQGANFEKTKLYGTSLEGADLRKANLKEADLSRVKSFCKTRLDPEILSQIRTNWPEKLATLWDDEAGEWVLNKIILEQVKKPDWRGWPEEKGTGK